MEMRRSAFNTFFDHIGNNNLELVKKFISSNPELVNSRNKGRDGKTPLICACTEGHLEMVKFFVEEANADLEAKAENGGTALHYSVWKNRLNIVKYLVEEGANIGPSGTEIRDNIIVGMDLDEICNPPKEAKTEFVPTLRVSLGAETQPGKIDKAKRKVYKKKRGRKWRSSSSSASSSSSSDSMSIIVRKKKRPFKRPKLEERQSENEYLVIEGFDASKTPVKTYFTRAAKMKSIR